MTTPTTDYTHHAILYVDDEQQSLEYFKAVFAQKFKVITAASAAEGLEILQDESIDIGVVISDQRMPGESGIELLEKCQDLRPNVIRILATAYSDIEIIVEAVNTGRIYHYVTKPWELPQLERILEQGLDHYIEAIGTEQTAEQSRQFYYDLLIANLRRALQSIAMSMNHHINNSMVPIKLFIDLLPGKLQEEGVDMAELKDTAFWQELHSNAQSEMLSISDNLRDLRNAIQLPETRFQDHIELRPFMIDVISDFSDVCAKRDLKIKCDVSPEVPELRVHRRYFRRMFELLLHDRIVNLPTGGCIAITAEVTRQRKGVAEIEISIKDQPDMSKSELNPTCVNGSGAYEYSIEQITCDVIACCHGGRITNEFGRNGPATVISVCSDPVKSLA